MNLRGELDHVRAMVERLEAKADDSDPVAWANARLDGFTLAPWQERVMRDEATRISLKCPRRSGKSTVTAALAAYESAVRGVPSVIAAPSFRQSRWLADKIEQMLRGELVQRSANRMTLTNGCEIHVLTSNRDSGRGAGGSVYLDECAWLDPATITALIPATASDSRFRLVMLSTPGLPRGAFYESQQDDSGFSVHNVTVEDVGHYTDLEQLKRDLGARYAVEMECEWMPAAAGVFAGADIDSMFGAFTPLEPVEDETKADLLKGFGL